MKKYSISSLVINCIFRACKIRAHALGGQKRPRSCQPRPLADWGTEPQTSIGQKFVVGMPGMPSRICQYWQGILIDFETLLSSVIMSLYQEVCMAQ